MLDTFKQSIDHIPVTVSREIADQAQNDFEAMALNQSISAEAIEDKNMQLGRTIWPHLKAYDELYAKYGKQKEHEAFLETLRPDVLEHFKKWNTNGSLIFDIRRGKEFEQEFQPEEKFAIEEAYLDATESARSYVDELVQGEKKNEYEESLKANEERQKELMDRIATLRGMANVSEKWSAEILGKVRLFELGWAVTEKDPELYEVEKEIENYKGMMDVDSEA